MSGSDLQHRLDGALREVGRLRGENERLRTLLALAQQTKTILDPSKPEPPPPGTSSPASADEKVALVRRLFRGRDDLYALRWESARTGKTGYAPATAEGWTRHGPKTYLPMSNEAIERRRSAFRGVIASKVAPKVARRREHLSARGRSLCKLRH